MSVRRNSVDKAPGKIDLLLSEGESSNVLSGLFDVKFLRISSARMTPPVYLLAMLLSTLACAYLVVLAFRDARGIGLLWLLVAPALFLGALFLARFLLEFIISILKLSYQLNAMADAIQTILETTADIVETTSEVAPRLPDLSDVPLARSFRRLLAALPAERLPPLPCRFLAAQQATAAKEAIESGRVLPVCQPPSGLGAAWPAPIPGHAGA
jgi:Domain of unknown function (DUF4282)